MISSKGGHQIWKHIQQTGGEGTLECHGHSYMREQLTYITEYLYSEAVVPLSLFTHHVNSHAKHPWQYSQPKSFQSWVNSTPTPQIPNYHVSNSM